MDALRIMSERPEKLIRSLSNREALLISILAGSGEAMIVDQIRWRYLERIYRNVMLNYEYIGVAQILGLLLTAKEDEKIAIPKHKPLPENFGIRVSIIALSGLYELAFPGTKKVPLIIGGATIKRALEDLRSFYSNAIEIRPMKDARTGGAYYTNDEFQKLWEKYLAQIKETVAKNPFGRITNIEAVFTGMESQIMLARILETETFIERAQNLIKHKEFGRLKELKEEVSARLSEGRAFTSAGGELPMSLLVTDKASLPLLEKLIRPEFIDRWKKQMEEDNYRKDIENLLLENDPSTSKEVTRIRLKMILMTVIKKKGYKEGLDELREQYLANARGTKKEREEQWREVEEIAKEVKDEMGK